MFASNWVICHFPSFAQVVLQAAYEATLTIASCLAAKKGARVKVGCLRSLTSERSSLHEKCDVTICNECIKHVFLNGFAKDHYEIITCPKQVLSFEFSLFHRFRRRCFFGR